MSGLLTWIENFLRRPLGLITAAGIFVFGSLVGVALFTFGYANGAAYLSNDPKACVNCHVMRAQYDGWTKSVHGKVAVCNDCHAPHDLVGKYMTKAINGWNHGFAFTTGRFEDNMTLTPRNREITLNACLSCHSEMTSNMQASRPEHDKKIDCLACHKDVGHL